MSYPFIHFNKQRNNYSLDINYFNLNRFSYQLREKKLRELEAANLYSPPSEPSKTPSSRSKKPPSKIFPILSKMADKNKRTRTRLGMSTLCRDVGLTE